MSLKPLSKIHQRVTTKQEDRIFLEKTNALPPNTFWDDASTLYHKSIQAVELTHGQLSVFLTDLMNDPARVSLVADPATLVANITLLTRDIGEHVDRLNAIYAQLFTKSNYFIAV